MKWVDKFYNAASDKCNYVKYVKNSYKAEKKKEKKFK